MWKYAVAFIVISVLTVYVSLQIQQIAEQGAQQTAPTANGPVVSGAQGNHAQQEAKNLTQSTPFWFRFFTWPDGVTAWAILLTLFAIAEQTKQTRKAAEAALVSANAANTQIQMMFEKERARLTITFPDESESMMVWPDKKEQMGSFRINLKNVGGTAAFNITASYDAFASEPDSIPHSEELFYLVVPADVEANSWEQTGPLNVDGRFSGDSAPQIFCVYARGVITYSDIFRKQPNITKFLIRRTFNRTRPGEAVSDEFWESVGDSGENEST
jgi:hypothetical protein